MARAGHSVPRPAGDAPQWASGLAVTVLCLLLAARVFDVVTLGAGRQVPFTVALFVLPLLYAVSSTRRLLDRYRWPVLGAQAVLTWVPFVVFGGRWQIGIGGLLAGLVLLMVPGRVSWLLAGGLLAAEVVVRAVATGLPFAPAWYGALEVVTYYVNDALQFSGLVRLAQIVGEVTDARVKAEGLAVAGERLQAARALQAAVGERLAGIAATAAAAWQAMGRDAARAQAQVAAAGAAARDAVAQAREVTAHHDEAPGGEPVAQAADGAVIGARLAWAVLVTVLLMYAADNIGTVVYFHYGARLAALAIADIVLVAALQLYHSGAVRQGRRPQYWPVTMGLQALAVYAFTFPGVRAYVGFLPGFLAGSFLLLVPGRWRWAGYAAVVASWPVLYVTLPLLMVTIPAGQAVPFGFYFAAVTALVGLLVYGLAWLAGLAAELEALGRGLARAAVVRERLRIARDVHDLLGLGLSAIALKADLICALIGRDDARAAAELGELGRICASARADARLVTVGRQRLSLAAELTAARQILTSAGIEVRTDIPAGPLPVTADDVLATVLREAVTNVLRHSIAGTCTIEASAGNGALRLRVCNDGVPEQATTGDRRGSGLANLTTRVRAVGGELASRQADGRFDLVAEIPLAAPPG